MAQAQRTSQDCIFMLMGEVVEQGKTSQIFEAPLEDRTRMYISGRYG
jgi:phosphate transport system ATP-binding protein